MAQSYKDLIVWQKAIDLAAEIYRLSEALPRNEMYALSDQMRRAAVSVPSNIAEGQARFSHKEFAHFLGVARGSLAEVETQLCIAVRTDLLSEDQIRNAQTLCEEVGKMLTALSSKIKEED